MLEAFRKRVARMIAPKRARKARVKPDTPLRQRGALSTRMYASARASRLAGGMPSNSSADMELVTSLTSLRSHSRQLVRDASYAKRGKVIVVNNVIGPGIGMQGQVKTTRGELNRAVNDAIEWAFIDWSKPENCHTGGVLHFHDFERAMIGQMFEAGEVFVRKHYRSVGRSQVPLALELIEAERVADETDPGPANPENMVRMGVEVDRFYRPVAYWFRERHQGEFRLGVQRSDRYERVSADQVWHLKITDRWPQTRGEPWLHAVVRRLQDMDGYSEAEIVAARGAASYVWWIKSPDDPTTPIAESQSDGTEEFSVEPGMAKKLGPGEDIVSNTPNRPNTAMDPFMRYMLREVAAGIGTSYESLSRDYCVAPDTHVLRADLRWVRADELNEGIEIVAFDEEAPGGMGNRRKWRKASVTRAGRRNLNRRRIVTDRATVTVSDEHLFLCTLRAASGAARGKGIRARSENPGYAASYGQRWVRADRLQPGDQIVFLAAPWATGNTHLHGYLKGIADGEGWVDSANAAIGIAQNTGLVCDEIGEALVTLGFGAQLRFANGGRKTMKWSIMGIGECLRFLGEVRPIRLLQHSDRIYDGRMTAAGAKNSGLPTAATVLAVEDVGTGPVVTLETSTRTLITEGLCSHNSQSNYSSSRLALLDDRDLWRYFQAWFIRSFREPLHREWLQQAVLARAVEIPLEAYASDPSRYELVRFKPRGWSWIDPAKEVDAYVKAIRNGLTTTADVIAKTGDGADLEDVLEGREQELGMMHDKGLVFDTDPSRAEGGKTAEAKSADDEPGGDKPPGDDEKEDTTTTRPQERVVSFRR